MRLAFGFLLTLALMPLLIGMAPAVRLLDHPTDRKQHEGSIPLVGGLAMFAIFIGLVAWLPPPTQHESAYVPVLIVSTLIVFLAGLADDRGSMPVWSRFMAQALAALIMVFFAGLQLDSLGSLFGNGAVMLGILAVPFTVFAVLGATNAFNLIDGLDGLAGGLALVATVYFAISAYLSGASVRFDILLCLAGVLIGFLAFNMRTPWQAKARVFMGDSGSLMLGFVLAWFAVDLTQGSRACLSPAAALWFLAIPLWDTVSLMIRRMLQGRSPFHPGRDHLHHILLRAGFRECRVVIFIHFLAVLAGSVGLIGGLMGVPDVWLFLSFLAVFAVYLFGVEHAWKLMRLLRRLPFGHLSH